MRKLIGVLGMLTLVVCFAAAQEEEKEKKDKKDGPPFGGFPRPGQIFFPGFIQREIKLTDEQKKQFDDLQKEVDAKLDKILTADQKKMLREMREKFGKKDKDKGPKDKDKDKGPPPGRERPPDRPEGVRPPSPARE